MLADDSKLLSVEKAKDVKGRFKVWQETYQLEFATKGIFEYKIPAYQIRDGLVDKSIGLET